MDRTNVVIVGGGPAGASCALFLAQRGVRATVIEHESFPRYHIGESLTGECGNCLRSLGLGDEMQARRHPVKWGVHVYAPDGRTAFWLPVMARDEEQRLQEAFTWQVRRSDFDQMMAERAVERGVTYLRADAVGVTRGGDGAVTGVRVRDASGREELIASDVLVDASGMCTFLSTQGVAGKKERGAYDRQLAVFSQLEGAVRDPGKGQGNTLIFYQKRNHWAWFIPIDDKVTSIGVVVPSEYFLEQREDKPDFLRRELCAINPELARRLPNLDFIEEVRGISNYSYEIRRFTGKGFLCIGDAHRFIDPVFSFGLYVAIKEGQKAAAVIAAYLEGAGRDLDNPFEAFERETSAGLDVLQDLIDAFWNNPLGFAHAAHSKHVDEMIDLFAGRIYMREPSNAVKALRMINETAITRAARAAAAG